MSDRKRIGILISGRGSNMLSIARACQEGQIDGDIVLVVSNKKKAPGLESAADMGINTAFVSHRKFNNREMFDAELVKLLQEAEVDLVLLAGFMRLLTPVMISVFPNRIMNIHPSLLPSFPGLDAQGQAADYGVKVSGATVHFVDEHLDHGPIIIQEPVVVADDDDGHSLSDKIIKIEHQIYPRAVELYCADRLKIEGRRVRVL